MARSRVSLLRLAVLLGSSLLSLAAAEGVLRWTRPAERYYPYFPDSRRLFYPSEAITPGVSGVSRFTTNSFGTRGKEPAGERLRLLALGGSTTACTVLDDEEAWPARLAEELNAAADDPAYAWVANAGLDGKNCLHHVLHAQYLLPRLPDIDVVLLYAGLNDVGAWLYRTDFDPHELDDPARRESRLGEAFRYGHATPADWPWWKRLELWKRAAFWKDRWASARAAPPKDGRIVQDRELRWLQEEQLRRSERQERLVPRAKLETLPLALDAYAANLHQIVRLCRVAGAEPVLVAQAIQHQFLSEEEKRRFWMGAMDGGETYVEQQQMLALLGRFNERMRAVATEERATFVDLPALLAGETDLFYDGVHFHERGAAVTARVLADALRKTVLAGR